MANAFDQFDSGVPAPSGNAFDQFDSSSAPAAASSAAPSFGEAVEGAATSLPGNIYQAGKTALSTINDTLNPFSEAYIEEAKQRSLHPSRAFTDWTRAGSGLGAIPAAAAAPVTGVVKSLAPVIAAPMTSAIQGVGEPIAKALNPNAQLPSREDVYSQVEPQAEQALSLGMPGKAMAKKLPPLVPTTQQLYDAADGDYAVARAMDVNLHPQSVANFAGNLQRSLEQNWFRDYKAPDVFNVLKELQAPPPNSTFNIADIDGVRRLWGDAAGDFTNPTQQRAAAQAIKSLDNYIRNIPQSDVISGDAQAVQNVLESARGNYAAAKRADLIESQQEKAQRQAGVTGAGANINNALRQKMNQILNSKSMQRGFSPDEINQINQIATGTPAGNLARKIGKLAPTGVVSGALALDIGSTLLSGVPMGATVPALVGAAAKHLGEASTTRGIEKLSESTRTRSPLAAQFAMTPRLRKAPGPSALGGGMASLNAGSLPVPALQSPIAVGAEQQNQQNVPGPPSQQKDGGAVKQQRATGGKVKGDSGHVGALNKRIGGMARRAKDGRLYVPDAHRPGKFLMVVPKGIS